MKMFPRVDAYTNEVAAMDDQQLSDEHLKANLWQKFGLAVVAFGSAAATANILHQEYANAAYDVAFAGICAYIGVGAQTTRKSIIEHEQASRQAGPDQPA